MDHYKNYQNFLFEKKGTITARSLRIRKTPEIKNTNIIGGYKKNDTVEILDTKGNWYKTNKGWISKKYVKIKSNSFLVAPDKIKLDLSKEDIKKYQQFLNTVSKDPIKPLNVDGIWGNLTSTASVVAIQNIPTSRFIDILKQYYEKHFDPESATKLLVELAKKERQIKNALNKKQDMFDDSWWVDVTNSTKNLWNSLISKITSTTKTFKKNTNQFYASLFGGVKKDNPVINDSNSYLLFDGDKLAFKSNNNQTLKSWPAVAGLTPWNTGKFVYKNTQEFSGDKNEGPVPPGKYIISKIQTRDKKTDPTIMNIVKTGYNLAKGKEENINWNADTIASRISWGNYRTSIMPTKNTNTFGRSNFYIHGGKIPGSHGCIDLTTYMPEFIKYYAAWQAKNGKTNIPLIVKYPKNVNTSKWASIWKGLISPKTKEIA